VSRGDGEGKYRLILRAIETKGNVWLAEEESR
jgi:hypothetical protein